ncbi:MAG: hypothetical protein HYT31_04530 [Parcubacteria group bacterium]|nr:hypothetical protein [Parcubacteria group bacterium]
MNKQNKALIFLSFFIVPELIWSPVATIFLNFFTYKYVFRATSFFDFPEYLMAIIVALQAVGMIGFSFLMIKQIRQSSHLKRSGIILLSILGLVLSIISLFVLLVLTSLGNIGF